MPLSSASKATEEVVRRGPYWVTNATTDRVAQAAVYNKIVGGAGSDWVRDGFTYRATRQAVNKVSRAVRRLLCR